jgi:hypothetical protein
MTRTANLQLIGPAILLAAALAAELGAYALELAPGSQMLWYINLKVFGLFQQAYYVLGSGTGIPAFGLFFIAFPIFMLGLFGIVRCHRLILAISSNLSFMYAGFLLYAWFLSHPHALQASLTGTAIPNSPDIYLVVILVGSSLLSCFISHLLYVRSIRVEN